MSDKHTRPDDPSRNPEQAVDAMEQEIFGTTMDQERDPDAPDPDNAEPSDGTDDSPTTMESPA